MKMEYKNNFRIKFILAVLICISGVLVFTKAKAQVNERGYFVQAEKLFAQKKYYEAIQYYEKYLSTEKDKSARSTPFAVQKKIKGKSNLSLHNEAVYHLAESYSLCNNYTKAEKLYREATNFSADAYPESRYWYAVTLRANKKYDEAQTTFESFRDSYKTMDGLLTGTDRELENLKFIKEQLSKPKESFFVSRLMNISNTSAYAMGGVAENKFVFTSINEPAAKAGQQSIYTAGLYLADLSGSSVENKEKLVMPGADQLHQGLATFNKRGDKMLFTQWTENNGIKNSAIYRSEKTDTGWSKPAKLGEPVNVPGFNSTEPFITSDGKYLLFSSDRPGGVGKYDIWYATLDSDLNPLLVNNTGNIINTAEDEMSPSYHLVSRTLLYSSNGFTGMGGFDIYSAKGDVQLSNWEKPQNAGSPINSSKDDLFYISTDEDNLWNTGIFSSDRDSDCCLDMFTVRQDNTQIISGMVTDCGTGQPIPGAALTLTDPKHGGKILNRMKTTEGGLYNFRLQNISRFDIKAEAEGYEPSAGSYTAYFDTGSYIMNNETICLKLIVNPNSDSSQDSGDSYAASASLAKFSYNKSTLGNGSFVQLDSLITYMLNNPSTVVEVGGYTDSKGSEAYNLKLAQKRVDACIRYLVGHGIDKTRLVGKAYGECCPLEPETIDGVDNPDARQRNRRVEYKVIK